MLGPTGRFINTAAASLQKELSAVLTLTGAYTKLVLSIIACNQCQTLFGMGRTQNRSSPLGLAAGRGTCLRCLLV